MGGTYQNAPFLGGVVGAGKLDPARFARPSLTSGTQGADGNRRLPNLPRGFLLQTSQRAKRAGAFRHGQEGWPPRKVGNGVHDQVSRSPWVWRRGVRYSPFGAGVWLVSRPIVAASRQSSSEFQALKPSGGQSRVLERLWQVVHGLQSRLMWLRVRYCLGVDGDCWGAGMFIWPHGRFRAPK